MQFIRILFTITSGILGLLYIGTIIEMLTNWIGFLGYVLWGIVAPLFLPVIIAFPWFEAWVSGGSVRPVFFWIWLIDSILLAILLLSTWVGLNKLD